MPAKVLFYTHGLVDGGAERLWSCLASAIKNRGSVFREVLASSGTFIDPELPDATAIAIGDLIAPPNWRGQQAIAATSNVQRWNAVAGNDLAAARSALSDARSEHSPSEASVARRA
jgi:hypothetical protein